jgi:hypothetical protein
MAELTERQIADALRASRPVTTLHPERLYQWEVSRDCLAQALENSSPDFDRAEWLARANRNG